jgi:hypothetical protein
VVKNTITTTYGLTCAWAPLSLTPSKTYMSYDSSKISIDRSLMTLAADAGRVDFTFTIKSVTYTTTKSVTFGVIISDDPCSTTVYSIDPIADITAIIPDSNVI